jgi:hypothetical protein
MKFYKIIQDNTILGVVDANNFVRYQSYPSILLRSLIKDAHFVLFRDTLYHAGWLHDVSNIPLEYVEADIISISEEEYELIYNSLQTEDELITIPPIEMEHFYENEEVTPEPEPEEPTTEYIRSVKLLEMKNASQQAITDGFDVVLFDGASHHFSLTPAEQLNILRLKLRMIDGEDNLPYHAVGEASQFYSGVDILSITSGMDNHIDYHNVYYNSLENYINNITDNIEISEVTYGMEIPEEYQSEVLKTLL